MFRRLLAILAGISLLLGLALWIGWAGSQTRHDILWFQFAQRLIVIRCEPRAFGLSIISQWNNPQPAGLVWSTKLSGRYPSEPILVLTRSSSIIERNLPGIDVTTASGVTVMLRDERQIRDIGGSLNPVFGIEIRWPIALILPAILPVLWLAIAIRRRRRRIAMIQNRLCLNCGYDLRASTDRCPECGTPIPAEQAAQQPA